ncbi:hypothetical protein Scep_015328 [Stephania cephalantha]|uniref:Uncharacterized protein n=1 Tax=Stephania cephalantha TaxID=152367 RepID=A0AAP0J540_9MAGN
MYGDVSVPKDREVYLGHGMSNRIFGHSYTSRLRRESTVFLSSLVPFHSATASACLVSKLPSDVGATAESSLDHNIFDKEKGDRAIESCSSRFEVSWDFSAAKYNAEGPDPISNFHITVMIDSEIALRLGEAANVTGSPTAEFSLVSRREHLFGRTQYSTKAQLCDSGATHDIVIRCTGNGKGKACRDPELSICIDEMQVICERSLQWKFRGNRVIYIDGQLVDVMWNFFDWFFKKGSSKTGSAVFMFRRRNGFHRSLWFEEQLELQEKTNLQECGGVEFSLMIYACKRP